MALRRNVKIVKRRGKFVVEYRDEHGKRPRPSFHTREQAEKHKMIIEFKFQGLLIRDEPQLDLKLDQEKIERITIKDAIKKFTEVLSSKKMAKTLRTEKSHFGDLFIYCINEKRIGFLDEITLLHMEEFQNLLLKGAKDRRPLKASSINRMFTTFSSFFNKCVAWGLLARNPIADLKKLPEAPVKIKVWEKSKYLGILDQCPKWASEVFRFLYETGCRPVDVERLRWKDIRLNEGVLMVTSFKGGVVKETELPISNSLRQFLDGIQKIARKEFRSKETDLVFLTSKGKPVTANSLGHVLKRLRGAESLCPYGLRHTYINSLVDLGVHPRDIQLLARHSKFETTTRYTHRRQDQLKDIVDRLSERRSQAGSAS